VKNTTVPYVDPLYPSEHNLLADPQLGGPFFGDRYGMYPLAGSPVIDSGNNADCPVVDILGDARPVDGDEDEQALCDMEPTSGNSSSSYSFLW